MEKTFTCFSQEINDMTDLVSYYLIEERDKMKYLIDSLIDMEINNLFTNDYDYLNNFTTFIQNKSRFKITQMTVKVVMILMIINLNLQLMQRIFSLIK